MAVAGPERVRTTQTVSTFGTTMRRGYRAHLFVRRRRNSPEAVQLPFVYCGDVAVRRLARKSTDYRSVEAPRASAGQRLERAGTGVRLSVLRSVFVFFHHGRRLWPTILIHTIHVYMSVQACAGVLIFPRSFLPSSRFSRAAGAACRPAFPRLLRRLRNEVDEPLTRRLRLRSCDARGCR